MRRGLLTISLRFKKKTISNASSEKDSIGIAKANILGCGIAPKSANIPQKLFEKEGGYNSITSGRAAKIPPCNKSNISLKDIIPRTVEKNAHDQKV